MSLAEEILKSPPEIISRILSNFDSYDDKENCVGIKTLQSTPDLRNHVLTNIEHINFTLRPWGNLLDNEYKPITDDSINYSDFDIDKYENLKTYQVVVRSNFYKSHQTILKLVKDKCARYVTIHGSGQHHALIETFISGVKMRYKIYGPEFGFVFYDYYYVNGVFKTYNEKSCFETICHIKVDTLVFGNEVMIQLIKPRKVVLSDNVNIYNVLNYDFVLCIDYVRTDKDDNILLSKDMIPEGIIYDHIIEFKFPIYDIKIEDLKVHFPRVKHFYDDLYFDIIYYRNKEKELRRIHANKIKGTEFVAI